MALMPAPPIATMCTVRGRPRSNARSSGSATRALFHEVGEALGGVGSGQVVSGVAHRGEPVAVGEQPAQERIEPWASQSASATTTAAPCASSVRALCIWWSLGAPGRARAPPEPPPR